MLARFKQIVGKLVVAIDRLDLCAPPTSPPSQYTRRPLCYACGTPATLPPPLPSPFELLFHFPPR